LRLLDAFFPRCWFNEKTTEAGRDALGYYHQRRDENRNVGLGPEKDWSSHCADSFGYYGDQLRRAARKIPRF
jgi:phage terminase large subunit